MSPRLWMLLSVLAALTTWSYMQRVLLPWEHYFNVEAGTLKETLGDLYSPWAGTRALLVDEQNPYGPEVTHNIQMAFYGHDIVQSHQPEVRGIDEQRFAYPIYVVFLLAPTARMKFETLQAGAPVVLALAAALAVWIWLSVLQWRPPLATVSAIMLFIFASPQIAQGLRLRQLGLLVACLLGLATWLVRRNHQAAAGAVLAVCTIKPQMMVLPLAWFLLWTLGDLQKRWRLLAGFGGALALLAGAGEVLLPGWHRDFLVGLAAYRRYGPTTTLLQLASGNTAGNVISVVFVAGLLAWGWINRKQAPDSPEFALTLAAFFIGAAIALPLMPPFNQVLLILPVLILLRDWRRLPRSGRAVFILCGSWPWIASLSLLVWPPQLQSLRAIPLLPSALVLLFPALVAVLLMARRSPIAVTVAE